MLKQTILQNFWTNYVVTATVDLRSKDWAWSGATLPSSLALSSSLPPSLPLTLPLPPSLSLVPSLTPCLSTSLLPSIYPSLPLSLPPVGGRETVGSQSSRIACSHSSRIRARLRPRRGPRPA